MQVFRTGGRDSKTLIELVHEGRQEHVSGTDVADVGESKFFYQPVL